MIIVQDEPSVTFSLLTPLSHLYQLHFSFFLYLTVIRFLVLDPHGHARADGVRARPLCALR